MNTEKAIDLIDNLIGMVDDNQENDYDSALHMAINALKAQSDGDTISRQAAIDALNVGAELLRRVLDDDADVVGAERAKYEWGLGLIESCISDIKELPSAQPKKRTEERTETHACDLISRQAVIDTVRKIILGFFSDADGVMTDTEKTLLSVNKAVCNGVRELPSLHPDQSKYEYHYDHTDCIWYRPKARNRCPVTCSQYRDGWNDAMNYIFRDGKGYRPYRRGEQYDE